MLLRACDIGVTLFFTLYLSLSTSRLSMRPGARCLYIYVQLLVTPVTSVFVIFFLIVMTLVPLGFSGCSYAVRSDFCCIRLKIISSSPSDLDIKCAATNLHATRIQLYFAGSLNSAGSVASHE